MRYDVEVVSATDPEFNGILDSSLADFKAISEEVVDANLEVWMTSEKGLQYDQWVDRRDAVSAGSHKLLSYSGMYVPVYVGDASNEMFFTTFLDPEELQKYRNPPVMGEPDGDQGSVCTRAEWNCSNFEWFPSHCRGPSACDVQLLRGPTDYYQGLLEQRIEANSLNISAAYTSMSTLRHEAWKAYASKRRFLIMNWEPNIPMPGLGTSSFQRVQFTPALLGGCKEASATPANGTSCDDPPAPLVKVISKTFAESADAFYFASAFSLSQDDYDTIFEEYTLVGESLDKASTAACNWLNRQGSGRYGEWIRFSAKVDFEVSLEGCWMYVWIQLGLLLLSMLARDLVICVRKKCAKRRSSVSGSEEDLMRATSYERKAAKRSYTAAYVRHSLDFAKSESSLTVKSFKKAAETAGAIASLMLGRGAATKQFRSIMESGRMGFFAFRRDEEDFISNEGVCVIPEKGQSHFRVDFSSRPQLQLFWCLMSSSMSTALFRAAQCSLAVGAMGTLVHIIEDIA